MRIELGQLIVEVASEAELQSVLQGLLRALTDKDIGRIMEVSDRTVRRWRRCGALPERGPGGAGRLTLLDLLKEHAPEHSGSEHRGSERSGQEHSPAPPHQEALAHKKALLFLQNNRAGAEPSSASLF